MLIKIVLLIFLPTLLLADERVTPFKCEFSTETYGGNLSMSGLPLSANIKAKQNGKSIDCPLKIHKITKEKNKDLTERYEIIFEKSTCLQSETPSAPFLRIDRLRSGRGYAFFRPFDNIDSLPCAIITYEHKVLMDIFYPPKKIVPKKKKTAIKQKIKNKRASAASRSHRRRS